MTAARHAVGLAQERHDATYHRVLNRVRWSPVVLSLLLLGTIVAAFAWERPLVLLVDETLEWRYGRKITNKGDVRDAVRSTDRHMVTRSAGH